MKSASIKPRVPERGVDMGMGDHGLADRRKELLRQEAKENLGTKNIMRV